MLMCGPLICQERSINRGDHMETKTDSKKLGLTQAAPVLGVSPFTLRSWTRERKIPFYRCGHRIVFAVSDLERFLANNRVEAVSR